MILHKCFIGTSDLHAVLTILLMILGNVTLTHLPPQSLRWKYLCIDHFDQKYIRGDENSKRIRLRRQAIPEPYQISEALDSSPNSPPGKQTYFFYLFIFTSIHANYFDNNNLFG